MTEHEQKLKENLHKAHKIMDDCEMHEEWGTGFEHALNWVCRALYELDKDFNQVLFKQHIYKGE